MGTISVSLPADGTTADVADYNTPITTIVNVINGGLDNANITAAAAIAGSKLADGGITPSKLATGAANAYVATAESLNTAGYTDLTTMTDTVTVTIGANGLALVMLSSSMLSTSANQTAYTSFAISGATTQAASDKYSMFYTSYTGNGTSKVGITFLLTGLAAGSTTFKMKYKATGNFSTWQDRFISVVPL